MTRRAPTSRDRGGTRRTTGRGRARKAAPGAGKQQPSPLGSRGLGLGWDRCRAWSLENGRAISTGSAASLSYLPALRGLGEEKSS